MEEPTEASWNLSSMSHNKVMPCTRQPWSYFGPDLIGGKAPDLSTSSEGDWQGRRLTENSTQNPRQYDLPQCSLYKPNWDWSIAGVGIRYICECLWIPLWSQFKSGFQDLMRWISSLRKPKQSCNKYKLSPHCPQVDEYNDPKDESRSPHKLIGTNDFLSTTTGELIP